MYACDGCSLGVCFNISTNGKPKYCSHNNLMNPSWSLLKERKTTGKYECLACGKKKVLFSPGGYKCPACEIEHGIAKRPMTTFLYTGEKYKPPKRTI
jgi:hypothetical protein